MIMDIVNTAVNKMGFKLVSDIRDKLTEKKATGKLSESISTTVVPIEGGILLTLWAEKYWKYVEHGRRPGKFPPPNAIVKWIKAKGITPQGKTTVNQLAFLIGRAIKNNGIKPTNIFEKAIKRISPETEVINELLRETEKEINKDFQKLNIK